MSVKTPVQIAWLVDAVGEAAALSFIENVGGRRLWIPRKSANSECERLYGSEIAEALCAERGGSYWDVPICREWRVMVLYCQGMPANDIASRAGCSRSAVNRILTGRTPRIIACRERARSDQRQMALFA